MASPQTGNGWTKIANELLEAFARTNFSAYQRRVIDAIIRKTYGYRKKVDYIAISQIVEITQIHKAHVSRTLSELNHRNIVTRSGNKIGLNKDWETWEKLPSEVTTHQKKVTPSGLKVTPSGSKKLPRRADTKERKKLTKENPAQPGLYFSEDQLDKITKYCKTLKTYFKKNLWPWVEQCKHDHIRPEIVVYALSELWEKRTRGKDPWPYLNQIVLIQNQNAHEREGIAEHKARRDEENKFNFKGLVKLIKEEHAKEE